MGYNKSSQSSTQTSSNQAFPFLRSSLGGQVGNIGTASGALSSLLGGDASGFNAYKQATGFNPQLNYGLQGITGASAANGLLNSGSSSKELQSYGQMLQNQSAQGYFNNLLGLGNIGLGSAGILAGAGQTSTGTSKGSGKGLQFRPPVPGGGG